jgi:hypothetical protein
VTSKRDDAADLTVLAADDALLDALANGEPVPEDDKLAGVLARWRADLDDDEAADFDVEGLLTRLAEEPDDAGDTAPLRSAVPADPGVPPRERTRTRWRPGRRSFVGVAAAVVLFAGLGVGAGSAGPDSPLWPIARVLYPERADVRLAEHNIALARAAADDGRYADARRTLDRAAADVESIDDRELAAKLRAQIDEIRRTLPATDAPSTPAPSASSPSPSAPAAPTGPAPTGGGQPGGGEPGGGQPGGGGEPGGGGNTRQPGDGIIPGIPGLPTPTLPIPVPTLPIPDLPLGPNG